MDLWAALPRRATPSLACAFLMLLVACDLTSVVRPANAKRFDPPAVYSRWWAMTQACSNHSRDMASIAWYRVPGWDFPFKGQDVSGYWSSSRDEIVLADEMLERGEVVRHEMLHALLRQPGHPPDQFLGACASVVTCGGCGPWHPASGYALMPAESLEVRSVAVLLPRESDGQRWVALDVSVENARDRAVVLDVPDHPSMPATFGFDIRGPDGGLSSGEIAQDSSTLYFAGFARKAWHFEFRVASDLSETHIKAGQNILRGGYGRAWAGWDTLVVIP